MLIMMAVIVVTISSEIHISYRCVLSLQHFSKCHFVHERVGDHASPELSVIGRFHQLQWTSKYLAVQNIISTRTKRRIAQCILDVAIEEQ